MLWAALEGAVARGQSSAALDVSKVSSDRRGWHERVFSQVLCETSYSVDVFVLRGGETPVGVHLYVKEVTVVAYVAEGIGLCLGFFSVSKYMLE